MKNSHFKNLKIILSSPLNKSKSKAAYSFGKQIRFKNNIQKDNYYSFYNLPSTITARSTSIGFGKKYDFTKRNNISGEYYLSSPINSFDSKYKNSPSYTIAKKYDLKMPKHLPIELYNCSNNFGNFSPKYSIGLKFKNKTLSKKEILPGPGYYYNERNHKLLKSYSSNFSNAVRIRLDLNEKRFKYNKENFSPGPGKYKIPSLINKNGFIFQSNFKSELGRSFIGKNVGNSDVKISSNLFFDIPGPGQYNFFSEFEGFSNEKSS